jgi:hypothetical protein
MTFLSFSNFQNELVPWQPLYVYYTDTRIRTIKDKIKTFTHLLLQESSLLE